MIICDIIEPLQDCTLLWIKQPEKQAFIAILALEKTIFANLENRSKNDLHIEQNQVQKATWKISKYQNKQAIVIVLFA